MVSHDQTPCHETSGGLQDPVCSMAVKADSAHHFDYKGTTYYFCCAGCKSKFANDPAHYLNPEEAASLRSGDPGAPVADLDESLPPR